MILGWGWGLMKKNLEISWKFSQLMKLEGQEHNAEVTAVVLRVSCKILSEEFIFSLQRLTDMLTWYQVQLIGNGNILWYRATSQLYFYVTYTSPKYSMFKQFFIKTELLTFGVRRCLQLFSSIILSFWK